MTEDNLKLLPKPQKKVAAKVLARLGMSYRTIGRILDVSKDSVMRYSRMETPEELRQFETDFKKEFMLYEIILAVKAICL